jgi:hypothetical protein
LYAEKNALCLVLEHKAVPVLFERLRTTTSTSARSCLAYCFYGLTFHKSGEWVLFAVFSAELW